MAQLNYKKIFALGIIAVIFAIFGWVLPITTSTNQTVGLNIVVNNTNLAPHVAGESNGTGERVSGTTYYNNNSDIELFVWGHAAVASQTAEIHLFINGTKVSDTSGRPVGATEQSNKTIIAIIPRYSPYMVEFQNTHHYEWREYQVLTGNFTSNITSSPCSGCVNQTQLNEKINKTADTISNPFQLMIGNTSSFMNLQSDTFTFYNSIDNTSLNFNGGLGLSTNVSVNQYTYFLSDPNETSINSTNGLNMSGKNIINCGNCDSYSKLVNRTYNSTGAVSTGTNTIPHDDTIPTSTEGFAVLNITYTPKNANNYLKICSQVMLSTSQTAANLLGNFVLYNNTTIGISNTYSPAQFFEVNTGVCAFTQAGTISPVLIQSRAGSNAAGTITINGAAGSRNYGGSYNTYLVVDEYVP